MTKQTTAKIQLFLQAFEERLAGNLTYFRDITADFKAGTKTFRAEFTLSGDQLVMAWNGKKTQLTVRALSGQIAGMASDYESLVLTYRERGHERVLTADAKQVRVTSRESEKPAEGEAAADIARLTGREYKIHADRARALLTEIGIMAENGKIKNDMIRKYNQIDHYIEVVEDVLDVLCEKHDRIVVVDAGCGKSYLSFVLNYYLREVRRKNCHFIGLDISETVIASCKKMAGHLGYHNMEFIATDIRSYVPSQPLNLLISLHACDTATDEAIAFGLRHHTDAQVVVPCCHKELIAQIQPGPLMPMMKHGIMKARFSDVMTDGLRAMFLEAHGYKVTMMEYISPLETPKNLMIKAIRQSSGNAQAMQAYQLVKGFLGAEPSMEKLTWFADVTDI